MRLKALRLAAFAAIFSLACHALSAAAEEQSYFSFETHLLVDEFQKTLRKQVNELLGITEMQRIIDGLSFERNVINDSLLYEVTAKLDSDFRKYVDALNKNQEYLTRNCKMANDKCGCFYHDFLGYNINIYPALPECSTVLPTFLRYFEQYGTQVNVTYACCILSEEAQHCGRKFHYDNLTSVFKSNGRLNAIRWQYVANMAGVQLEYPAHVFSVKRRRHWKPFLSSALPYRKRILVLLDAGTIQTEAQLLKLKGIAEILLDAATSGDRLMVMVDVGSEIFTACDSHGFVDSLENNIAELKDFIEQLTFNRQPYNNYSHARALKAAYKLFVKDEELVRENGLFETFHNVILYASRGVMSDLNETVSVLAAVGEVAVQTSVRVKINTIAFSERGRELMMWTASFLKNIAQQNYTKHKHSFSKALQTAIDNADLTAPAGETIIINGSENTQLTLMKVYKLLSNNRNLERPSSNSRNIHWSQPFIESQSTIISLSKPVWDNGTLAAVVGMDIILDRFANVLKFRDEILMAPRTAFLHILICDTSGRVLVDSRFTHLHLWPLHISELESWQVEDRYLSDVFASEDVSDGSFDTVTKDFRNNTLEMKYSWKRLEKAPFVVVLAMNASNRNVRFSIPLKSNTTGTFLSDHLFYHRLDLKRDSSVQHCLHHGAVSSLKLGGVFLSQSCLNAHTALHPLTLERVNDWWIYLSGRSDLYSSVGIRRGVKEHINALWKIVEYWKDIVSKYSNRIIRHYVATSRGVMLTYPASVVRADYEPTIQPWYNRALKFPGRLVLTGPVLDQKLGLVITISTAIFEGLGRSMHNSETDQVFAVVAMDVSVGFLPRLLRDSIRSCKEERRCIIFDDLGYVLARGTETGLPVKESKLSGRNSLADAVERFHINHLEPQLATHLITNTAFVQKGQCIDWKMRSYERFFQFNVSTKGVLKLPCGESSSTSSMRIKPTRAEIIAVPRTNIFLVLLNESCTFAHQAFCPCSVLDRRCLLCSRFDDTECECPCQCPLHHNTQCVKGLQNTSVEQANAMPPLPLFMDVPVSDCAEKPSLFYTTSENVGTLPECLPARCEEYRTVDDCLLGVGCQWCTTAEDGESLLEEPFCSGLDQCYGGVKGRKLKDVFGGAPQASAHWSMATPVGAVAAGIMSVFLIMVMAVYCYRSQVNRFVETRSLSDSFGTPIFPQTADEDEFQFDYDEPPEDKVQLASFEQLSNMRPLVRPQLRPSPRTESSDQGYSTMTDRMGGEESEGASSSVNISRRTERTFLMPLPTRIAEDCSNSVVVEADVHQIPPSYLAVS